MATMFTINGKMATQNAFLAFAAYNRAKALVSEHNGTIDFVDGKNIKATFKSNKMAKTFVTAFESEYAEAHKAYEATKTSSTKKAEPKKATKPTVSKAKATPKKTKGNKPTLNDFVVAHPLCTREEAKAYGFNGTRADLKALKVKLGVR